MTKPTGRPKGRPRGPEYTTLMARVPLDLAEQVRRYAGRKQQPISEVLRDGLQLLFEQEESAPRYVYDRNTPPVKVSDTKEDTALALEASVAHQAVKMSDTKEAPLPLDTPQPVIVSDTKDVPAATPPQKGRKPVLRQPILAMLRQYPEGLTAAELRVHLKTTKHIGDTLAGMVRAAVVHKHGSKPHVRYTLPATPQAG